MVRLVACGADCLGDISDGGDVADIVHQKVNQFFKKDLVPNLVFFDDVADNQRVENIFVHVTELFAFSLV